MCRNTMALGFMAALMCSCVFVNAYLYSDSFYESLYFCLRME